MRALHTWKLQRFLDSNPSAEDPDPANEKKEPIIIINDPDANQDHAPVHQPPLVQPPKNQNQPPLAQPDMFTLLMKMQETMAKQQEDQAKFFKSFQKQPQDDLMNLE